MKGIGAIPESRLYWMTVVAFWEKLELTSHKMHRNQKTLVQPSAFGKVAMVSYNVHRDY